MYWITNGDFKKCLRFFDHIGKQIELEPLKVTEFMSITFLRFRVIKGQDRFVL